MSSRLPLKFTKHSRRKILRLTVSRSPFSTSCRHGAQNDLPSEFAGIARPSGRPSSDRKDASLPPRSAMPTDGSNPSLHGYPSATNRNELSASTATPDTTTPERASPLHQKALTPTRMRTATSNEATGQARPPPNNATQDATQLLSNIMRSPSKSRYNNVASNNRHRGAPPPSNFRESARRNGRLGATKEEKLRQQKTDLERQMTRIWQAGDVYAPKDLSPFEQVKARDARQARYIPQAPSRAKSRKRGGADTFDVLRLNPINEYKNFTMMGEFVSETGRIKGARETGLRAVNQRKLAKAVRRTIGMGLMPSVHKHPELLPERIAQRSLLWTRNGRGQAI